MHAIIDAIYQYLITMHTCRSTCCSTPAGPSSSFIMCRSIVSAGPGMTHMKFPFSLCHKTWCSNMFFLWVCHSKANNAWTMQCCPKHKCALGYHIHAPQASFYYNCWYRTSCATSLNKFSVINSTVWCIWWSSIINKFKSHLDIVILE